MKSLKIGLRMEELEKKFLNIDQAIKRKMQATLSCTW